MGLVTAKEVAKAINIDKYGFLGTFIGWFLMKITRISSINTFYDSIAHLEGLEYSDAILKHFEIDYEIPEEDFKRLPKEGAYVTISNHPLGAIDGILLLKLMGGKRADYKTGFKSALLHLKDGHPLGIFPAGEVSTHKDGKMIVDKPWETAALKLIRKAEVPVVPIYFHAKNSKFFYRLSKISGVFRTAKIPSEVYTQKNRPIKIRIGQH